MRRFVAAGILIGIILGIFITLLLPNFLTIGMELNKLSNQANNYPSYFYSPKSGGIFNNDIIFVSLALGLVGAITGMILFKIKRLFSKK